MSTTQQTYDCDLCQNLPGEKKRVFEPLDSWLSIDTDQQFIHIHFGTPAWDEKLDVEEGQWLTQHITPMLKKHSDKKFFVLVDFSRGDNTSLLSKESKATYQTLLKIPNGDKIVFLAGSPFIRLVARAVTEEIDVEGKITQVESLQEASKLYRAWLKAQ